MTERAKMLIVETCDGHAVRLRLAGGGARRARSTTSSTATTRRSRSCRTRRRPTSTARSPRCIAAEIEDGACLQIGIGGMPNAVCALLKDSRRARPRHPHRDAGRRHDRSRTRPASSPARARRSTRYQIVFTFAAGSRRQYDFIDRNPRRAAATRSTTPTCRTTSCRTTASSRSTTRRRSTCRARRRRSPTGHRHLTGTGGQLQFVRGAYASQRRQVVHLPLVDLREGRRARGAASSRR